MNLITAKARLPTAVNRRGTNATERDILIGGSALVHRNTHGRWIVHLQIIN